MSSRVRCSLEWEGARYFTNRQVSSVALQIYRRYVGAYYRKVKPPEVPLWKYLSEMWEGIPELPESARLRVWRERRGSGRKRRVVEAAPQRAATTRTTTRVREQQVAMDTGVGRHELRFTQPARYTTHIGLAPTPTVTNATIQPEATTFHWMER